MLDESRALAVGYLDDVPDIPGRVVVLQIDPATDTFDGLIDRGAARFVRENPIAAFLRRRVATAGLLATFFAVGCGPAGTDARPPADAAEDASSDADGAAATDAVASDAGFVATAPVVCTDGAGAPTACDFTCLYEPVDPAPAAVAAATLSGVVLDFFDQTPLPAVTVALWLGPSTPGAPDGTSAPSAGDGTFVITLSNVTANVRGVYRTTTADVDYRDTYHVNEFVPAAGAVGLERFVMPDLSVQIILGLYGVVFDPAAGQVIGRVADCLGQPVAEGIVRLHAAPHACGGAGAPLAVTIGYFDGTEYPDPSRSALNVDGLWIALNVPSSAIVAEVWGTCPDCAGGGATKAQVLACVSVDVVAGAVHVTEMPPLDVPAS